MPDFNTLMAEMVARARPQQAPPPARPIVMSGGGGLGSLGGKATEVSASIDPMGIAKAFGYRTPEEHYKQFQDFVAYLESIDPSLRDTVLQDPKVQEQLRTWREKLPAGGGIIPEPAPGLQASDEEIAKAQMEMTPEQYAKWRPLPSQVKLIIPPLSEAARTRGLTGEQIMAGAAGPGPAKALTGAQERLRQAAPPSEFEKLGTMAQPQYKQALERTKQVEEARRPPTATQELLALKPEEFQELVKRKQELEKPSEDLELLRRAQAAELAANTKLLEEKVAKYPKEAEAELELTKAKTYHYTKTADAAMLQAQKALAEIKDRFAERKELATLQAVERLDSQFAAFHKAQIENMSKLPTTPQNTDKFIMQLAAATRSHIAGVRGYTGEGTLGLTSFMTLHQHISEALTQPPLETGWFGSKAEAEKKDRAMKKKWVAAEIQLLRELGSVPKGMKQPLIDGVLGHARQIGMTNEEVIAIMVPRGE